MTLFSRRRRHAHWSNVSESGSLAGIRLMVAVYDRLGGHVFQALLFWVTLYYWLRRPLARHASRTYQRRLRAFCPQVALPRAAVLAHFQSFGTALLERILALHGRLDMSRIVIEDRNTLHQAIAGGRGGLIVVTHLGSHEICQLLGQWRQGLSMSLVMHSHNAQRFNSLFDSIDRPLDVELIEVSDMGPATAQRLKARIEAGGFVVIAADREPIERSGRRRSLSFLGSPADFPEGAFWLAMLLRCPLYLLICARHRGRHHVHFEALGDASQLDRREREAWLADHMARFVRRLEHFCCRYPLQWFNFYPFWQSECQSSEPSGPHRSTRS